MAFKRLFIDSDVQLDLLLNREPFHFHSQVLLLESFKNGIILNTSALIIANINYILSKQVGSKTSREKITDLIKTIKVLPLESDIVDMALASDFADFEDAMQFFIAVRYSCDAIITRNIKDYKHSTIPVLTPEQFLRQL
jgi:predicted nucleic acid-binding protein